MDLHGSLGRLLIWDTPLAWWMVHEPDLELLIICALRGMFGEESDELSWLPIGTAEGHRAVNELALCAACSGVAAERYTHLVRSHAFAGAGPGSGSSTPPPAPRPSADYSTATSRCRSPWSGGPGVVKLSTPHAPPGTTCASSAPLPACRCPVTPKAPARSVTTSSRSGADSSNCTVAPVLRQAAPIPLRLLETWRVRKHCGDAESALPLADPKPSVDPKSPTGKALSVIYAPPLRRDLEGPGLAGESDRAGQPVLIRCGAAEDCRPWWLLDHQADTCERQRGVDAGPVGIWTTGNRSGHCRRGS
jgi:hypothetical protein